MLMLENGATFTVDCYYNIPDAAALNRLEIYGTRGSILAEGTLGQSNLGKVQVIKSDQGAYDPLQQREPVVKTDNFSACGHGRTPYQGVVEAFAGHILDGTPVKENSLQDGMHILGVALAAYQSSQERRAILIDKAA
jgi:predicted dehydrogenase